MRLHRSNIFFVCVGRLIEQAEAMDAAEAEARALLDGDEQYQSYDMSTIASVGQTAEQDNEQEGDGYGDV